ncbi:MAG: diguanylate cyclase [Candidatus Solibacter usitatus]|nr:diguanylate cyclase [Candidatus Solibacter usitatus]
MSWRAKVFIGLILVIGAGAVTAGVAGWASANRLMFIVYFSAALLTSGWKVSLPGIRGTMSANFLYVLIGIVELSLGETILIAVGSVLRQCLYRSKSRTKAIQAVFNIANISIAVFAAYSVFHSRLLEWLSLEFPLRLAAAATVYFVTNTIPISIVIALTESKRITETWRTCYFWSFSYYLVGAAIAGALHLLNVSFGWQSSLLVVPVIYLVYRSYSLYLSRLKSEMEQAEIQRAHAEEMSSLHLRTIEALALAIEAKDQTTHDHLRRVEVYCMEMGRILNLSQDELHALQAASLLHDIGKLAVPEHILSKPGKLTPEEFEKIKIHPVVGAEILERVRFPYPVEPIVRHHHERWDGNGYPEGLAGEAIPLGARILSAVDCLDALASDRQYRRALPLDKAMEVVAGEAGKTYDPRVVEALCANYIQMERKARDAGANGNPLKDRRVERNAEPAAGFESGLEAPVARPARFLHSIGAARQEAQLLYELAQGMVSSLSLSEMLGRVTGRFMALVKFDAIAVYLVRDKRLEAAYVAGDDSALFESLKIPMGQGISGWVAENKKPIRNGNPSVEPGYLNDPKVFSIHRSALAVPLEGSDGILGALALYSKRGEAFSQDDLRVLIALSSKLGLAIENGLRYRQAEDTASKDYLTGLPNARTLFLQLKAELALARKNHGSLAVLLADLDGFKKINDSYGHLTGNRLLKAVAGTLHQQCRAGDLVARMGGDEFVIVCPKMQASSAGDLVTRVASALTHTGIAELGQPLLSASIGVAVYPEDGEDPEQLLAVADRMMYRNKPPAHERLDALWNLAEVVGDTSPDTPQHLDTGPPEEERSCIRPANS